VTARDRPEGLDRDEQAQPEAEADDHQVRAAHRLGRQDRHEPDGEEDERPDQFREELPGVHLESLPPTEALLGSSAASALRPSLAAGDEPLDRSPWDDRSVDGRLDLRIGAR
jgi:hypothetical protein